MNPYQYVVLRCVPRVEREEFVNVGVVLYSEDEGFLASAHHVDEGRLLALSPSVELTALHQSLDFVDGVCRGDEALGAVSSGGLGVRFGYLKAPRSTVVQPGPVHGGLTDDPAAELARLLDCLVG